VLATDRDQRTGRVVLAVHGRGVVAPDAPVVTADDAGLTRGDGCFEGLRLLDGTIAELDAHLARMARSARALGIDFDTRAFADLCAQATAAWPATGEASVKFVLTRGPAGGPPTAFVTITELPPDYARQRREGLRVITLNRGTGPGVFTEAPWLLGGVKTLSYAINMAAQREATRRGVDEAIFTTPDGTVLEAPTGSVVWAVGRTLRTTPLGPTGILAGTTQALLFEQADRAGWRTSYEPTGVAGLQAADAVWIVSSVRGPIDVIEINGTARARDQEIDAAVRALCGF
jgi:4-amino-4-deoxychorismate lyase